MFVVAIFIIRLIYNCYIFNIEIDTRWYNQKKKDGRKLKSDIFKHFSKHLTKTSLNEHNQPSVVNVCNMHLNLCRIEYFLTNSYLL